MGSQFETAMAQAVWGKNIKILLNSRKKTLATLL